MNMEVRNTTTPAIRRRTIYAMEHLGLATSYLSEDGGYKRAGKPTYQQLSAWDEAAQTEPIIAQGLDSIALSVLNKIGPYQHGDKRIKKFIDDQLRNRAKTWISHCVKSIMTYGFSLSEQIYAHGTRDNMPATVLDDIVNYHPLQVMLITNDNGRIVDGDTVTASQYKSGYWVPLPPYKIGDPPKRVDVVGSHVRLPSHKRLFINYNTKGNNPWGTSCLTSVLDYSIFKRAFRDMMLIALDRYGTPLIYVIVPPGNTGVVEEAPDGTEITTTIAEQAEDALRRLSTDSGLVLTQLSKEQPVQVGALTTGNNFSDSFERAISLCDNNMLMGMGIPNLLMQNRETTFGTGRASEIQLELFDGKINSIFDTVIHAFTEQVIGNLIRLNFDPALYPLASNTGYITRLPGRATDLAALIEAIKQMHDMGFLVDGDRDHIRSITGLPDAISSI